MSTVAIKSGTHNAAPTTPKKAAPIVLPSVVSARLVSRGAIALSGEGEGEGEEESEERNTRRKRERRDMEADYPGQWMFIFQDLISAFVKGDGA